MAHGPRIWPLKPKTKKKTPLTFKLDDGILRQLRDRSASTGFRPGVIVEAALQHVFVQHRQRDWLTKPGPRAAIKKARTLHQHLGATSRGRDRPPKSFRWIGAYLERNGYLTSEGLDHWPGSSVKYYLEKYPRPR